MLLGLQFPLADVRGFLAGGSPRLPAPVWPIPKVGANFVRYFGPVARRSRGTSGIERWSDDLFFCHGRRALILPDSKGATVNGVGFDSVARRFYSDGKTVARFEIEMFFSRINSPAAPGPAKVLDVLRDFLNLPTRVATIQDHSARQPLMVEGGALARLYFQASRKFSDAQLPLPDPIPVRAGAPMVFVVYKEGELETAPLRVRSLPAVRSVGLDLSFARVPYSRREIGAWLLKVAPSSEAPPDGSPDRSRLERNARLCVFRLHAEFQVFKEVLSLIRGGALPYLTGTPQGDKLDTYLKEGRNWLFSRENFGIEQAGIRALMEDFDTLVTPEEKPLLMQQLDEIRPQNLQALERDIVPRPRFRPRRTKYDLFISYNSRDQSDVVPVVEELRQLGVRTWFDAGEIPPGTDIVTRLEEGLKRTHAAAVVFGKRGFGRWQKTEVSAIFAKYAAKRYRIFPIILQTAKPTLRIPELLRPIRALDLRAAVPGEIRRLAFEITGQELAVESASLPLGMQAESASTEE